TPSTARPRPRRHRRRLRAPLPQARVRHVELAFRFIRRSGRGTCPKVAQLLGVRSGRALHVARRALTTILARAYATPSLALGDADRAKTTPRTACSRRRTSRRAPGCAEKGRVHEVHHPHRG